MGSRSRKIEIEAKMGVWVELYPNCPRGGESSDVVHALAEFACKLAAAGRPSPNARSIGGTEANRHWVGFVPEEVWPEFCAVLAEYGVDLPAGGEAVRPVALVDLDGTLADFDGSMREHLARVRSDTEPPVDSDAAWESFWSGPEKLMPAWLAARRNMVKSTAGFFRSLKRTPEFWIAERLKRLGFNVHILTAVPKAHPHAAAEKVEWILANLPEGTKYTLTRDKSLCYGRILVDDWPGYVEPWLRHRPRGLVLMPERHWNKHFEHPQVVKFARRRIDGALDAHHSVSKKAIGLPGFEALILRQKGAVQ
jgi:5'-nucleotidase